MDLRCLDKMHPVVTNALITVIDIIWAVKEISREIKNILRCGDIKQRTSG